MINNSFRRNQEDSTSKVILTGSGLGTGCSSFSSISWQKLTKVAPIMSMDFGDLGRKKETIK